MSAPSRILLLGAGRVAGPAIGYLLGRGIPLTVASDDPGRAEELVRASAATGVAARTARVVDWSAADESCLDVLLGDAALAISLLPPQWHVPVARRCLNAGVHLVTTSYVSPEMAALEQRARRANVVLLNEIGLDPGIDHLSAMALIEAQRAQGRELVAFGSQCGGLPADSAVNPWGYKLSWSPLGVLQAARKPARYRQAGRTVELDARQVCAQAKAVEIAGVGILESLANRDATTYASRYELEGIPTIYRATLRYPGWASTLAALHLLDLLDSAAAPEPHWNALLERRLPGTGPLTERARQHGIDEDTIARLQWLGLFEPIPLAGSSLIEALARQMLQQMSYEPGEQDLVVLRNELDVTRPGAASQRISATLTVRGDACGESAMARTVGLPAAIAAELLLQPDLARHLVGVRLPLQPELYQPILRGLEQHGLGLAVETSAIEKP